MPAKEADLGAEQGAAPGIGINVFGVLSVSRDGTELKLPQSRKTRALLAYLAIVDRPQRREHLCEVFWDVPDDPRGALRWSLSRLRQVVGDALETTRDTVALDRETITLDYDRVRKGLTVDLSKLEIGELEEMVGVFRGVFLDGLSLPRCPEFDAWRTAHLNEVELAHIKIRRELVDRLADEPARALVHAQALKLMNPSDDALAGEVSALSRRSREQAFSPDPSETEAATTGAVADPAPPPIPQQIRYCSAPDGVRLAYATVGEGYPLLKCGNWMSDLQYDWDTSVWRHWIGGLSARNRLTRYDQRGNGLSDRDVEDFSFDAQLRDLEAVAEAACPERFALLGISAGAALSVAFAVRHPERVTHLVLYGGRPRGWKHSGTPEDRAKRTAMITLIRGGWGQDIPAFRQLFTSLFIPDATPEQMEWHNELQRRTVSPENAARLHDAQGDFLITDLLDKVTVPTLVLHAEGDALVPFQLGRELAIGIHDSRFVALDSRNHILLAEEPAFATFLDELHRFVG